MKIPVFQALEYLIQMRKIHDYFFLHCEKMERISIWYKPIQNLTIEQTIYLRQLEEIN